MGEGLGESAIRAAVEYAKQTHKLMVQNGISWEGAEAIMKAIIRDYHTGALADWRQYGFPCKCSDIDWRDACECEQEGHTKCQCWS